VGIVDGRNDGSDVGNELVSNVGNKLGSNVGGNDV
jgi:hypothetical protein